VTTKDGTYSKVVHTKTTPTLRRMKFEKDKKIGTSDT